MLMAATVVPGVFSPGRFADPAYHLNLEVFLRGIDSNGVVLVDAEERLYEKLCDAVEPLAGIGKGKTSHTLFEELLKKRRQKVVRFVKTICSFDESRPDDDVAASLAQQCKADALIVESPESAASAVALAGSTTVIPLAQYIESGVETERRRCCEALPSLDQMAAGEFDRVIVNVTRFSKWLRFYDKQIGKGTGLSRFRRGLARMLQLWIDSAHFPKADLSVELFTVVDESQYRQLEPSVAYHRVKGDLVDALQQDFGIPIKVSFKRDNDSICHARHLQTQSIAVLFERGFDFVGDNGSLSRAFIKVDGACVSHLQEYRRLPEYLPGS
jgi:hypothetical protein